MSWTRLNKSLCAPHFRHENRRLVRSSDGKRGEPFKALEQSKVYQEVIAEREEILRLKWLESEKMGRDIGFDSALLKWVMHHQDKWRAIRRADALS